MLLDHKQLERGGHRRRRFRTGWMMAKRS